MKLEVLLSALLLTIVNIYAQPNTIELLVRGDDIASSHAANVACIESYNSGIMQSVEIMVPCPWFPEAVKMLKENPGLDVGVHLVLTSEWLNIKWRPMTCAPGLSDKAGYFFPFIWPNDKYGPNHALLESDWTLEQVEKEFRAQIELAMAELPNISHLSGHMGCPDMHKDVREMTNRLAKEYDLYIDMEKANVKRAQGYDVDRGASFVVKLEAFVNMLNNLEPGRYLFVEHPGMDVPEMQAIGHIGYSDVANDRDDVTRLFTHPLVMEAIVRNHIKLISYADLAKEQ